MGRAENPPLFVVGDEFDLVRRFDAGRLRDGSQETMPPVGFFEEGAHQRAFVFIELFNPWSSDARSTKRFIAHRCGNDYSRFITEAVFPKLLYHIKTVDLV